VPALATVHHQPQPHKFTAPGRVRLRLDPQQRFAFVVGQSVRAGCDDGRVDALSQVSSSARDASRRHFSRAARSRVVSRRWDGLRRISSPF
jgi:hypothetical protein